MAGAEPRRLPLLLLLVFPSSPVGAALRLLLGAAPPFTCSQPVSAAAAGGALGARWRRAGQGHGAGGLPRGARSGPDREGGRQAGRRVSRFLRRSRAADGRSPPVCRGAGRGGGLPRAAGARTGAEERPGSRGEGAASPVEGLRGSGGRPRGLALPGKGLSGGGRGAPGRGPEPGPVPLPSERGAARALGRTPGSSKGSGPDAPEPPHPQPRPRGRRRSRRAEPGAGELAVPRGAEPVASAGPERSLAAGGNRPGRRRGGGAGGGERGRVSCPVPSPGPAPSSRSWPWVPSAHRWALWSCCWPRPRVALSGSVKTRCLVL